MNIPLITGSFNPSINDINKLINQINSSLSSMGGAPAAGTLTGTTLAANVVHSSLTSLGTLASLSVTGVSSLDGGKIITDGSGNLHLLVEIIVDGDASFENNQIYTTGNGHLTAVEFVGSGAGLTNLPSTFSTLTVTGTSSLDNGDITTNGTGTITVAGDGVLYCPIIHASSVITAGGGLTTDSINLWTFGAHTTGALTPAGSVAVTVGGVTYQVLTST